MSYSRTGSKVDVARASSGGDHMITRFCRRLTGHRLDGITGRCHLCRAQVLDPIKD